jgi:hypothetical protein
MRDERPSVFRAFAAGPTKTVSKLPHQNKNNFLSAPFILSSRLLADDLG